MGPCSLICGTIILHKPSVCGRGNSKGKWITTWEQGEGEASNEVVEWVGKKAGALLNIEGWNRNRSARPPIITMKFVIDPPAQY